MAPLCLWDYDREAMDSSTEIVSRDSAECFYLRWFCSFHSSRYVPVHSLAVILKTPTPDIPKSTRISVY
jgi:hypothetical protein